MEFKVGDRVFHKVNNLYGVITSEKKEGADGNFYFSVKFDNDYEWFVQEKSIISIKDAPKNPYQQKIDQPEQRIEKLEKCVMGEQNSLEKCVNVSSMSKNGLLTEDERVILRNLNKRYKWIARDSSDNLWLFENEPKKSVDVWDDGYVCYEVFYFFDHLFQFIKWEDDEPYNIEELLKEEHIEKFPKLKKLKDLTFEEYKKWIRKNCTNNKCSECPFKYASCDVNEEICWINGKNMYSNEFLNQEIEIEQ